MRADLIQLVWRRAAGRCEYCQIPQDFDEAPFEVAHIIARKRRGATVAENPVLSGFACNAQKGPNIAGLDPRTGRLAPLFHPRRQKWSRHFRWEGAYLRGLTAVGRTTVDVLDINDPFRVELREALILERLFPPE